MAGHSKWSNIKHRKSANDAKRAKYFSKLIREITAAVKQGSSDIAANPRLRLAIQNAKGANMPRENIDRAIQKGNSVETADFTTVIYEGNASHGVAIIVICNTDNLNRTVANVRAIFSKNGGTLGKNGSVSFLFHKKGVFEIPTNKINDEEAFTLAIIEAGADAIASDEQNTSYHITCPLENFGDLQKCFESLQLEPLSADIQYIPQDPITLQEDSLEKIIKLIDALEDNDDVQQVYHNIGNLDGE